MKKKKTITEQIFEIYDIWDNEINGIDKARIILHKLYLQEYNRISDMEEKRLILHNLTTAEIDTGNKESAKIHSKILKEDMEKIPNYANTHKEKYAKALNNYIECNKDQISKEKLIELYNVCYKIHEDADFLLNKNGYLEKLIAKFNLNLTKQNFNIVFETIKNMLIHNIDNQYTEAIRQSILCIKEISLIEYKKAILLQSSFNSNIKIV